MAEREIKEDSVMVCPFFLHANCLQGDDCEFSHKMTDVLPENVMCEFYLRGMCKYGDNCWFSHGKPKRKSLKVEESCSNDKIKMRYSFRHPRNKINGLIPPREISSIILNMRETYADIVKKSNKNAKISNTEKLPMEMCIHYDEGRCPLGCFCPCIHGNLCELCRKFCLNPYNREQQKNHLVECEKELVSNMEYSFAIQNSRDKVCGICLETVLDKEKSKNRRFGILEKCNHVFCLSCIREWRRRGKTEVYEPESIIDQRVMRACPQCRVQCDFVTPSHFWYGSEEEKQQTLKKYKESLKSKDCKHFKKGTGKCPFGGHCFYRHVTPEGVQFELPPPVRRERLNRNGEIELISEEFLWDFIVDRIIDEHFLI